MKDAVKKLVGKKLNVVLLIIIAFLILLIVSLLPIYEDPSCMESIKQYERDGTTIELCPEGTSNCDDVMYVEAPFACLFREGRGNFWQMIGVQP